MTLSACQLRCVCSFPFFNNRKLQNCNCDPLWGSRKIFCRHLSYAPCATAATNYATRVSLSQRDLSWLVVFPVPQLVTWPLSQFVRLSAAIGWPLLIWEGGWPTSSPVDCTSREQVWAQWNEEPQQPNLIGFCVGMEMDNAGAGVEPQVRSRLQLNHSHNSQSFKCHATKAWNKREQQIVMAGDHLKATWARSIKS